MSKLKNKPILYYKQTFTSAQMGTKETIHYLMPGRITMDVFELIKTNYKLRAYNLNAVSQHFLQDQKKDDMDYKDIPRFQTESSAKRGVMAKYCLQDTVLVVLLMDKLQLVTNNIEMARVVGVNMLDVWERGQSFKILRKILQYTAPRNVFIPTFEKNAEGKTYVPYYDSIVNDQMATETVATTRQRLLPEFAAAAPQQSTKRKRAADSGRTIAFQGATVLEPTVGPRLPPRSHNPNPTSNRSDPPFLSCIFPIQTSRRHYCCLSAMVTVALFMVCYAAAVLVLVHDRMPRRPTTGSHPHHHVIDAAL